MEPETETALIDRQRVPEPVAKAGHVITDRSGTDDDVVRMQGNLGIVSGIALIVGTIIGSGIFISLKGMLEGCGSIGLTLIIWVACGALSTMGALVYAELGSAIPKSGLIAFLNCLSVKVATRVQVVCTVTKLLALVIIALGGLVVLGRGAVVFLARLYRVRQVLWCSWPVCTVCDRCCGVPGPSVTGAVVFLARLYRVIQVPIVVPTVLQVPIAVPIVVPVVVLLACLYLLLAPVIQNPGGSGSFTLLLLIIGIIVYIICIHNNIHLPGIEVS
nr:hypothetical protein BaRGS_034000 [Batillaria attramentaria]